MDTTTTVWRKSSYSNASSNNCVEVADQPGRTAVRDTQNRHLGTLRFASAEWRAFVLSAKNEDVETRGPSKA